MRLKHIFLILFLVSIGVVAVLFVRAMPHQSVAAAPAAPPPPKEEILVATRPLAAGLLLRAQDVTWRERHRRRGIGRHRASLGGDARGKARGDEAARAVVYGAALHDNRAERQPIRRSTIVKPGDRDFLQTVLAPGTGR